MKRQYCPALATLLVVSMLVLVPQTSSGATYPETDKPRSGRSQSKVREEKVKSGPEVARRVIQLKQNSQAIRNALKAFEKTSKKTGRMPKIEEAWAITSRVSDKTLTRAVTPNTPRLQKTAFRPQDTVSEYGVEIIFIPTYSVEGEWQGTFIANIYDSEGNFVTQYVADAVFQQDANFEWTGVFEVSFEGNQAYLESDPNLGMITNPNFEFGTPVAQQTYEGGPGWDPGPISSVSNARFLKASYIPVSPLPQWGGRIPPQPRARRFARCTIAWCAGTGGVGCGVLSLLSAGAAWGPCAIAACSGSAAACAIDAIIN